MAKRKIDHETYLGDVQTAAIRFQALEEALKIYLTTAFELIRKELDGTVPFHFISKDIQKEALGSLVRLFAKYSSKAKLVEDLNPLPAKRNYIAHQAYLVSANQPVEEMAKHIVKVRYAGAEAKRVLDEVVAEARLLVAKLK